MSNTTQYLVIAGSNLAEVKNKKSAATAVALQLRNELGVDVLVSTAKGNVVFEMAAPKKIKMSKPYTRVVPVPAEVAETINGKRVAYKRTRVGFALLDAARGDYSIFDLVNRVEVGVIDVKTTREAGRFFADEAPALRARLQAAEVSA